jgi:aminoglycoside 6-adenylyltransferase
MWESLFTMGDLFRGVAKDVAKHFGFEYPEQDDKNVTDYLQRIRSLPADSKTI